MRGWIALIAVYGLVVVGGGSLFIGWKGPVNWFATHTLPPNHLISKGDLKEPREAEGLGLSLPDISKLIGRFVIARVDHDRPVEASNLRNEPRIDLSDKQFIYWFALVDQPLAGLNLDAGISVDLCTPTKDCLRGEVAAIRCVDNASPACFAGICLRTIDRERLLAWGDKPKPLALVIPAMIERREIEMDWPEVIETEVDAQPGGIWTLVAEYVRGPALIKIEADNSRWNYSEANGCTADGDLLSTISTQACILKGAPVGALIGKIGGSTAGTADGTLFLAGKTCIIELDASKRGPLYLTVNDESTGMANNRGKLKVKVFIKRNPEPSSASPNA